MMIIMIVIVIVIVIIIEIIIVLIIMMIIIMMIIVIVIGKFTGQDFDICLRNSCGSFAENRRDSRRL